MIKFTESSEQQKLTDQIEMSKACGVNTLFVAISLGPCLLEKSKSFSQVLPPRHPGRTRSQTALSLKELIYLHVHTAVTEMHVVAWPCQAHGQISTELIYGALL